MSKLERRVSVRIGKIVTAMVRSLKRHRGPVGERLEASKAYRQFRELKRELYQLTSDQPAKASAITKFALTEAGWTYGPVESYEESYSDIDWDDVWDDYSDFEGDFTWFAKLS